MEGFKNGELVFFAGIVSREIQMNSLKLGNFSMYDSVSCSTFSLFNFLVLVMSNPRPGSASTSVFKKS